MSYFGGVFVILIVTNITLNY